MVGTAEEISALAQKRLGQMLRGKYRMDALLGVGGMASVYAATHRNGRRVAVKVLHTTVSLQGDMRKRFLREGHAANAVNHPGAVVVIDDDIAEDGAAFLVMELLEGDAVEDLWKRNGDRLPTEMVLAVAYELCNVLDAAHRAGIVHRDIKPANLFLTREGGLKVLDFGLAQLRDGQAKLTATGMVFGTPAFMSPEQASGRSSQVDPQSDLWALGATMFTLLSGFTVHEASTVQDMVMLAATKPARSLAMVMPKADPQLVGLIDRALMLQKTSRWPSAATMRTAIGTTNLALYGQAVPKLASWVGARFGDAKKPLVDLSASVSDSLPRINDTDPSKPVLVDLSGSGEHSDDAGTPHEKDTDADIPNARNLPLVDMSQDVDHDPRDVPSDAPTGLYRPAVPLPPIPRPPPAPSRLERVGPATPPSFMPQSIEASMDAAETIVQSGTRPPFQPVSIPEPPVSSRRNVTVENTPRPFHPPQQRASSNGFDQWLDEVRTIFRSIERIGIERTLRKHPQAAVLLAIVGSIALAIVGFVIVLIAVR